MSLKFAVFVAACVFGVAAAPAFAAPGVASGSVNLRTGPGTGYARIATIPAGARVEIIRCGRWCEVVWRGYRGWASAGYLGRAVRGPAVGYGYDPYPQYRQEWPLEDSIRQFNDKIMNDPKRR